MLFAGSELEQDTSHQSTILDLRLLPGIGILLMLYGYSYLYASIGGVDDKKILKAKSSILVVLD